MATLVAPVALAHGTTVVYTHIIKLIDVGNQRAFTIDSLLYSSIPQRLTNDFTVLGRRLKTLSMVVTQFAAPMGRVKYMINSLNQEREC